MHCSAMYVMAVIRGACQSPRQTLVEGWQESGFLEPVIMACPDALVSICVPCGRGFAKRPKSVSCRRTIWWDLCKLCLDHCAAGMESGSIVMALAHTAFASWPPAQRPVSGDCIGTDPSHTHHSKHQMQGPNAEMLSTVGSERESCLVTALQFRRSTPVRQASMDDWSARGRAWLGKRLNLCTVHGAPPKDRKLHVRYAPSRDLMWPCFACGSLMAHTTHTTRSTDDSLCTTGPRLAQQDFGAAVLYRPSGSSDGNKRGFPWSGSGPHPKSQKRVHHSQKLG